MRITTRRNSPFSVCFWGALNISSGLKELMWTIYAPVSVDKMLQGHTFARAVRAHLHIQTALSNIILEQLEIFAYKQKVIDEVKTDFQYEFPSISSLNQNSHLVLYFNIVNCGHFAYAKSCHIYMQDMRKLPLTIAPEEYENEA
ncbi:hypothetical protein PR048_031465 [Dryococelus australis]|uniref:Uncharacterized protein n=1 Tax=Dryococelus australis TaxID=614101 RepID=A0ABQ9G6E6_9NEOP|nr:hypothetical protein PR048_031465 [Dryococelus australis]